MKNKLHGVFKFLIILIFLASIATSVYFYYLYDQAMKSGAKNQQEIQKVLTEVSKFMDLPTDESPTIATVTDPSKLTKQDFFKKAQKGV